MKMRHSSRPSLNFKVGHVGSELAMVVISLVLSSTLLDVSTMPTLRDLRGKIFSPHLYERGKGVQVPIGGTKMSLQAREEPEA